MKQGSTVRSGVYAQRHERTVAPLPILFLLKTFEGGGYAPPACTSQYFADVPCSSPFATWVYELVRRGITAGCGNGNYCPLTNATRGQMAAFLVYTFNLS